MRRFKELLANKFVWGPKDVEHEKKPKRETKDERAGKFIWGPDDVEHHGPEVKEELDEKFHPVPADTKGNFGKPHQIHHSDYDYGHPHNKAKEPQPGDDAHDEFLAHHENLNDDEKHAVEHYKSTGYKEINKHLRDAHKNFKKARAKHFKHIEKENSKLKFKDDPESHIHMKATNKHVHPRDDHEPDEDDHDYDEHNGVDDHVHHLDNVTSHRTTQHHTVYRGGFRGDKTKFPIGHEFTDHGFVSSSFRKHKAEGFAKRHQVGKDEHGYGIHKTHIHVIHIPKGSRGHYFDVQGDDAEHSNASEKEFVLHRGTRFKVTHHSEDATNHYIHARVVKQGIRHKFVFNSKQKSAEGKPKDDHGLPGQKKFPFMKHHERFK